MEEPWKNDAIDAAEAPHDMIGRRMSPAPGKGTSSQVYTFGPFTIDERRGLLLRDEEELKLRPKSFEVLCFLARNSGRLVSKAELMQELWPDTAVGDDALPHCIMEVRKALGSDGSDVIKTIPARGYLFEAKFNRPQAVPAELVARRKRIPVYRVAAVLLAALVTGFWGWRAYRAQCSREALGRIEELANNGSYFKAYELAIEAARVLPGDERLRRWMPVISDDLTVLTKPAGARVYLRRIGQQGARELVGSTPIERRKIGRGEYILTLEKPGYAPLERTLSSAILRTEHPNYFGWGLRVDEQLRTADSIPEGMVLVPGGQFRLQSYDRPSDASALLGDFLIDRFEVSNREFKEFVEAGGYVKPEFWKIPAMREGKALTWDEVTEACKDQTGLPGPRDWRGGTYPEGRAEYPVTNISWYEAAAYAAFRGKRLPTIYEWEKAARGQMQVNRGMVMPWGLLEHSTQRANFESNGPVPVASLPFGMGPYGAYHMAGNVREWCRNEYQRGFVTAGGGWNDPAYRFGSYGAIPAFQVADTLGFRCARGMKPEAANGDQRFDQPLSPPVYSAVTRDYFKTLLSHYRYDAIPLEAKVEREDDRPDWKELTVTYQGANGDRALAVICLPKNTQPPYQVIHYVAGAAFAGVPVRNALQSRLAPHIRAGRAVFLVSLQGFAERPWPAGHTTPRRDTVKFREQVVRWTTDIRRGIDYLRTRDDIDHDRVALWNVSADVGAIFAAVEERYRSVILMSGGFSRMDVIAEADPLHFAPHIRQPKLQLVGRFDEGERFLLGTEPAYKLLSEPKRQVVYEGGHLPPIEVSVPVVNRWLDETIGKVERR